MTKNAYDPDKDPTVIAQRKKNQVLFQLDWLITQDPVRWYLFGKGVKQAHLPYTWITEALQKFVASRKEVNAELKELKEQLTADIEYCHKHEDSQGRLEGTGPSGIRWDTCLTYTEPDDKTLADWLKKQEYMDFRSFLDNTGVYTDTWELTACGLGTVLKDRFLKTYGQEGNDD